MLLFLKNQKMFAFSNLSIKYKYLHFSKLYRNFKKYVLVLQNCSECQNTNIFSKSKLYCDSRLKAHQVLFEACCFLHLNFSNGLYDQLKSSCQLVVWIINKFCFSWFSRLKKSNKWLDVSQLAHGVESSSNQAWMPIMDMPKNRPCSFKSLGRHFKHVWK